jgi:predicted glycosyltransferase
MKILVGMMHPKHVYIFKNFIYEMIKRGHEVEIAAIEKDITESLLKENGLQYNLIGKNPDTPIKKFLNIPLWTFKTLKIAQQFKPDIFIGQAFPHFAYVSAILRKPYVIFEDTESAQAVQVITFPFASSIVTPSCYEKELGKKHIRFDGYFELAYLHPNYFTPDPSILKKMNLDLSDTFIIVRFVSWQAIHDAGHSGLTLDTKRKAIQTLEKYGKVFISSEKSLPKEFEKYRISTKGMHDLLSYATLLYGESSTMASECAVLGTHAIYCDFTGRGYTNEEQKKYNLVFNFKLDENSQKKSIHKAVELLIDPQTKNIGRQKQNSLLSDKIDVTGFMVWFIEDYPRSVVTKKTFQQY